MAKNNKKSIEDFEKVDISPFTTSGYDPTEYGGKGQVSYSILLSRFVYDFKVCKKLGEDETRYGSGYEYEQIFQDYLDEIGYAQSSQLHYDSENGMFCVYSYNKDVAIEVGKLLTDLYKQEAKMLKLIKEGNKKYGWRW